MTTLKNIFDKPVDRPIEGVIKADDEQSLQLELEEYVLTNEVAKRLESFLDAYNNYEGANGVWVSGFFGSGKSHLLKILALLLENRRIEDVDALDLFLHKCGDEELLRADLKRAAGIPSKSILFNIDQKADVISKTQTDALLAVFVKVFDEMRGYYGKQGHIAQFERDLDSRGLYEQFKTSYEVVSGRAWKEGREQSLLESENIARAYAEATGSDKTSATGILDKYRSEYSVSIEDFAEQVRTYIEGQDPDFRLNFFVDEVGQYIAENVKLMTNLQTIAESLATKCRGRAWMIVTAQEDMETVLGEKGKQQGNDFSKIQDRFANRMKLTSADVAEVIQKRLLMKNDEGLCLLSDIYDAQENNLKTLFDFADGSKSYRNFRDRDHFINSYPFVPYQFDLFQSAIQNLSQHDAFEGKHSSVGERSMLGVFRQVAIQIGDHETGRLATFDLMFEGIRTALKSDIQRAVIQAEKQLDNSLAVQLLKTLFLVKYVKDFKPTARNLSVLVLGSFSQDIPALREKVQEALNLLENQTYVQRNGEFYEYLTDQEKDVEKEIKATEVENVDVLAELEKIVFTDVIETSKIRYNYSSSGRQRQDYPYSRKIDDRLYGREHELAISIISPFNEHANAENEPGLRTSSTYKSDELFVVMPPDEQMMRDMLMYKKTEKYVRQNISITQQDEVKRILTDKGLRNEERRARLRQRVRNILQKARLFVAGREIEVSSDDPQNRIVEGFGELVSRTYANLGMLGDTTYTENDVANYLKQSEPRLIDDDVFSLSESEREVLSFVQGNKNNGVRTTLKSLVERFERKPYGWPYAAVLCTLASLCGWGRLEVWSDGNLLEEEKLIGSLRNSHGHSNIVLEPQVEFTASQVRALKEFYGDFFDGPPKASEAKALGKETGVVIKELVDSLVSLEKDIAEYPFRNVLAPVLQELKDISGKSYAWYVTELVNNKDNILGMKENIIDPVSRFMNGQQKKIFDDARKFMRDQEHNLAYVEGEEHGQVLSTLNDLESFKGNSMQLLKTRVETLRKKVTKQVDAEVAKARETVAALKNRLCGMNEFVSLREEQQRQLSKAFEDILVVIGLKEQIAVIRDVERCFEESDYNNLLSQMTAWTQSSTKTGNVEKIECVPLRTVPISFEKAWLEDETDVDRYLESLRKALLGEISRGKRIQT